MLRIRFLMLVSLFALLSTACSAIVSTETIGKPETDPNFSSPPPAVLHISDLTQEGGLGSYCWTDANIGASMCADAIGIPTSPEPLMVASPLEGSLEINFPYAPRELTLTILPVDEQNIPAPGPKGLLYWNPGVEGVTQIHLPIQTVPAFNQELAPGKYVFNFFVRWIDYGDASYGFFLEVQ